MADVTSCSSLFLSFSLPVISLILVDLHGTVDPNSYDTIGNSELKIVQVCTRTMSFSVIFVHLSTTCLPQTAEGVRDVRVWCGEVICVSN